MGTIDKRGNRRHQTKKNKQKNKLAGKIAAVAELAVSAVFYGILWNLGMLPTKYMLLIGGALLIVFAVCFVLQFGDRKASIIGIVLSVGFALIFAICSLGMRKVDSTLGKVGGATYKTDNMIVAVRKDDQAEMLLDAKDYKFGCQLYLDKKNTELMLEKIEKSLGKEIEIVRFESVEEVAEALLNKKIDAAVYNEAFHGMISDKIEDYESKIKILYQYGIDTELDIEEKSVKEPFNIYISGIDVYGPITTNSRSDVNIIMTVNPETRQILLTSTPRDYYVEIPGVSNGQKDKLTHAGIYGVDRSMATLEAVYGIKLNYYARVNFSSLIKIIDVLGGVDVHSDYAFTSLHGKFKFKEGINHMNGEQALGFARERYSFKEGDNQRGKNQEAVITAILQKAMSPAILKNANSLIASVGDSVETNMTKDELAEFIRRQLEDGSSWNIVSVNAKGSGSKAACYSSGSQLLYVMNPNMDSVAEIKGKMEQVLRGEAVQ